jgi:rRNA processing protein Gar1
MMRIGQIIRFSSEGTIIVRAQAAPPMGAIVCDHRGRDLGKVIRVTGPVSAPYAIVRPAGSLPEGAMRLIGHDVYLARTEPPRDRARAPNRGQYERRDGGPRRSGPYRRDGGGYRKDRRPDRR